MDPLFNLTSRYYVCDVLSKICENVKNRGLTIFTIMKLLPVIVEALNYFLPLIKRIVDKHGPELNKVFEQEVCPKLVDLLNRVVKILNV